MSQGHPRANEDKREACEGVPITSLILALFVFLIGNRRWNGDEWR